MISLCKAEIRLELFENNFQLKIKKVLECCSFKEIESRVTYNVKYYLSKKYILLIHIINLT